MLSLVITLTPPVPCCAAEWRINSLPQVGCDGQNSWVSHHYRVNTTQTLDASTSMQLLPGLNLTIWQLSVHEENHVTELWVEEKGVQWFSKALTLNARWFTVQEIHSKSRFSALLKLWQQRLYNKQHKLEGSVLFPLGTTDPEKNSKPLGFIQGLNNKTHDSNNLHMHAGNGV